MPFFFQLWTVETGAWVMRWTADVPPSVAIRSEAKVLMAAEL